MNDFAELMLDDDSWALRYDADLLYSFEEECAAAEAEARGRCPVCRGVGAVYNQAGPDPWSMPGGVVVYEGWGECPHCGGRCHG